MLKYELKKLWGNKFIVAAFVVLFLVNALMALYSSSETVEIDQDTLQKRLEQLELYNADPDGYRADYEACAKKYDEDIEAQRNYHFMTVIMGREDMEPPVIDQENMTKYLESYRYFRPFYNHLQDLPKDLEKIIVSSKANLIEYEVRGLDEDDYAVKRDTDIVEIYTGNKNLPDYMIPEYARGWDAYFAYTGVNVCLVFFVLILGCHFFNEERTVGMYPVIHATKKGRLHTAMTKYLSLLVVIFASVVAFSAMGGLIFGIRSHGLSSLSNYVQIFDAYIYCPFMIKVGEYLALSIVIKTLSLFALGAVIMMLSQWLRTPVLSYLGGAAVIAVNFVLHFAEYRLGDTIPSLLNLFTVLDTDVVMTLYHSINFFGLHIRYLPAILGLYILITVAAVGVGGLLFARGMNQGKGRAKRVLRLPRIAIPCPVRSATAYELHKTLIAKKGLLIILAMLAVKLVVSNAIYQPVQSNSDTVFKTYMTELAGEVTDEKLAYIEAERARIDETLFMLEDMMALYEEGSITQEEYNAYMKEYSTAELLNEIFPLVEARRDYLVAQRDVGVNAHFAYDTGVNAYLTMPFDYFLYALLLVLFAGALADEHGSGLSPIIRCTKRGRNHTFRAKLIVAAGVALCLVAVCTAMDWHFMLKMYEFPEATLMSPVRSMPRFGGFNSDMTVLEVMVLRDVLRTVGFVLLSVITVCVSSLSKKALNALAMVCMATLMPYFVYSFGLNVARYIDFTGILQGTQYLDLSIAYPLYFILFSVALVVIAAVMYIPARRRWNRS